MTFAPSQQEACQLDAGCASCALLGDPAIRLQLPRRIGSRTLTRASLVNTVTNGARLR